MRNSNLAEDATGTPLRKGLGKCNVTCPMCSHAHIQHRLNPRMYWHTGVDLDGKPVGFRTLKVIEGVYPPLYELWHCPLCHFTCHNRTFLDPLKNVFVQKGFVQRRYAEILGVDGPLHQACLLLGDLPSGEEVSFSKGIRLALLAVLCDQVFSEILNQRRANLARSCLRLAWLHRDWKALDPEFEEEVVQLNGLLDRVRTCWPEAPRTENEALHGACENFSRALRETSVSGNLDDVVDILLILAKVHLQMGEKVLAMEAVQLCRTRADEVLREILDDLRRDDREKRLSSETRSGKVQTRRKMEKVLLECQDLRERA